MMDFSVSAMMKFQTNGRRKPMSRSSRVTPWVLMMLPLAANNGFPFSMPLVRCARVDGRTDTSAPVSMRNDLPDFLSVTKSLLDFDMIEPTSRCMCDDWFGVFVGDD